jgi:hypothetical protein
MVVICCGDGDRHDECIVGRIPGLLLKLDNLGLVHMRQDSINSASS